MGRTDTIAERIYRLKEDRRGRGLPYQFVRLGSYELDEVTRLINDSPFVQTHPEAMVQDRPDMIWGIRIIPVDQPACLEFTDDVARDDGSC